MNAYLTRHLRATESDHVRTRRKRDSMLRTLIFAALVAALALAAWAQGSEPTEYLDAHRVGVAIAQTVRCP